MYNVLIVDDSKFMRLTLKKMIEDQADIKVVGEAENDHEGVEKFKELKPDLVIMDIIMEDEGGLAALKSIIELEPEAKVLMVSAMGQYATMEEAMKIGAKGFVVKPVKKEILMKKLNSILQQ